MSVDVGQNEKPSGQAQRVNAGEWIMPPVSYVNPSRRSCALCGRPIARRYWSAKIEEQETVFCEPDHARLYATYLMS